MVVAKKIIYAKKFDGVPTEANFRLETEELPPIKDGEILCEAEFLSVDPYMRAAMVYYPENSVMIGGQVAKVIASKNTKFPAGSYVFAYFGWRTHTVVKPAEGLESQGDGFNPNAVLRLPDYGGLSRSLGIGYLGMPGVTAYFGFLEVCQPKSGEIVVITGAAGAVGSLVGQIAKIKGCTVIGFAGSDDKCDWLKNELGFDYAFNYKKADIAKSLDIAAPEGFDCYFDNVGGETSSTIISKMRTRGRIAICGTISGYNDSQIPKVTALQGFFIGKQLKMEGFLFSQWDDRISEAVDDIMQWIKDGKIKYHETITKGFENMPQAFIKLFSGDNLGKAVIHV